MISLLLALWLTPPLVLAQDPVPLDIKGWEATRYNDHLVNVEYKAAMQVLSATQAMLNVQDEAAFTAWREQCDTIASDAILRLKGVPPYKGDPSLRDAVLDTFLWLQATMNQDFPALHTLLLQEEVHNADLARAEELVRKVNQGGEAVEQRLSSTQKEFARRHGFILTQVYSTPELDLGPVFSFPGLPPEGSVLTAEQHASFAMRYHNGLTLHTDQLLQSMNHFIEGTAQPGYACDTARLEALKQVQAELALIQGAGDWQGDASLLQSSITFGALAEAQLSGPYGQYCGATTAKRPTPAALNLANKLAQESAVQMQAELNAWHGVAAAFRGRWGLDAWEAWLREQGRLSEPAQP